MRHLGVQKVIIQTEDEKNSIRFVVLLYNKGNKNLVTREISKSLDS